MKYKFTDRNDEDFLYLCRRLDEYFNDAVGKEIQEKLYNKLNFTVDVLWAVIAYDEAVPIACAAVKRYDETTAELKRVFTLPEYRGRKTARRIISMLEKKAAEKGFKSVILETGAGLEPAIRMYGCMGYKIIPNYGKYKGVKTSVCMEKRL